MDPRKLLAQRLYIGSARGNGNARGSIGPPKRELSDRKRLPSLSLVARVDTSYRAKKQPQDTISPYIRTKVSQRPTRGAPEEVKQHRRTLTQNVLKKTEAREEKKKAHVHGDSKHPVAEGISSTNPFDILYMIKHDPELTEDFWYLKRKDDPYEFEFVSHHKRDPEDYLTISSRGVTYFKGGQAEFLSLEDWDREYRLFKLLKQIPFFNQYKRWKNFSLWKNYRRFNMIKETAETLDKKLLFLNDTLREPLLSLRTQAYRIMKADLIDLSNEDVRPLDQFNKDQDTRREKIAEQLEEIEGNIKDLVSQACSRFTEKFKENRRTKNINAEGEMIDSATPFLLGDTTNKSMPYTVLAVNKGLTMQIMKYIVLCDYMLIDSKLSLTIQSTKKVIDLLLKYEYALNTYGMKSRKLPNPLIMVNCTFEELQALYNPTIEKVKVSIQDALMKGITVVCNNHLLVSCEDLQDFISELDDEQQNEDDLDILQMAINNDEFEILDGQIKEALDRSFIKVEEFALTFQDVMALYQENELMDFEIFRNTELEEIKKSIEKYLKQSSDFSNFKITQNIGVFQLNAQEMKDKLIPSPKRCLGKLEVLLPDVSNIQATSLFTELNTANRTLMGAPANVDEFINYSKFLKVTVNRLAEYGERFNNIKDLNQMMEIYGIKYDEAVQQKFSDCLQALTTLRQRVQVANERDEGDRIKFTKELKENIVSADKKVKEVVEKLKDDRISDRDAQPGMVMLLLKDIGETVEKIYNDSRDFTSFQDELELERSNFEYIADMRRDFKLKNDMWSALYEWGFKIQTWYNTPFKDINVEQIGKEVDNYFRIAMRSRQLEEQGNFVPELLRSRVEELKNTMPVVVDLRSPSLLERHWEQIKAVLEREIDISKSSFTLKTLIDMRVNDKKEEIADIALKAKKEQELEKQLTEVVRPWETIEFQLRYNKDKDVYTLTALDELISNLEDTQVSITSIISNRFVQPLYDKVEPWQKKFALFSSTLDEWMNVQRQWLYLENIFASPDIIKQLPVEHKKFAAIDTFFKKLMRGVADRPLALPAGIQDNLYKNLKDYNGKLEDIQKALEDYLDRKRKQFPRFYFLSNEELLEILAQSRVPSAVQPHLRKIFESIYALEFSKARSEEILAMISAEGEKVNLSKNLRARDSVEEWLKNVELDMAKSLRREMKEGFNSYDDSSRADWVLSNLAQVVSCVGCIMWTFNTEEALSSREEGEEVIGEWLETIVSQLEDLTQLVRTDLSNIHRRSVVALVTQDVHNRDTVEALKVNRVSSPGDFKWQQQLRYYFNAESEDCCIRQVNSTLWYGYEYMGATTRLVITPLTDRCWITITGALHIKLGASPAGPAGTGKTESVKDLAKAVGQYCIVFNCSEQITFMMMEKLFLGLCNTGSWSCLDEFNRIDIEVLSVIAQQLRTIRNARHEKRTEFFLDDKHSYIKDTMGVFITMNPGYAGRTELPDNLKVLFRPMSMMVPDYTQIAEIMLFAEGFSEAKRLSGKMTKLYKLSSEQLSQQDHYDFGMRAVKSVLNMAGALKRKEQSLSEEAVLIRAMRDSNVPKFLKEDLVLFHAIVQDLFPGVEVPYVDYGELAESIGEVIEQEQLQPEPAFIEKVIQLYETFSVRFGVMIVGGATTGKSTCFRTLATALSRLRTVRKSRNNAFQEIEFKVLNPKAIDMGELYGEYNVVTQDWKDGLASSIMRSYSEMTTANNRWVVFDGPVDSLWIENMNTVLDDNMMLCLANGQRIKLKHEMRILFEVQDLAVASPATVSRCGMVYMTREAVGWRNCMVTWIQKNLPDWSPEQRTMLQQLFDKYGERGLSVIRKGLTEPIPTFDLSLIMSCCALVKALTLPEHCPRLRDEPEQFRKYLEKIFMFSMVWTVGGALDSNSTVRFEAAMTSEFSFDLPKGSLYDSFVSTEKVGGEYRTWEKVKPEFVYDPTKSYFELVVPTKDTVRFSYLIRTQVRINKPVFLTGPTGVGKTVIIADTLYHLKDHENVFPVFLTFSAQTSSVQTQNSIMSKLDSKRKDMFGGPGGKKAVLMIDDVNMPAVEQYGAQPPIELMRQFCDHGYVYERSKHFPVQIIDTTLICCAAPPEGGRSALTPRFTRHFHMLCMPPTSEENMTLIFRTILEGFFAPFKAEVQALAPMIVQGTLGIYRTISSELLPTPAKSHYTFNLRDVSKVFQGILMSDPRVLVGQDSMIRLWVHETSRVFHDRLVNEQDRGWINNELSKLIVSVFRKDWTFEEVFESQPILFGDFLKGDLEAEDRFYDEVVDHKKLVETIYRLLEDYNYSGSHHSMDLVFFQDALAHLFRICRMLRQPRGNAMLIGVGGCGKQSLTRLASFICNSQCFQVQVTKNYSINDFHEDLKTLFKQAGGPDELSTVFLLTDTQIVKESFLEDINNILNSGEVPNLFTKEEIEEIEADLRPIAAAKKVYDNMYNFFIQRVRDNLHVVLCMSPVGEVLRVRMRMFPSLVNCCTIDWVDPWPEDALFNVGKSKLADLALEDLKREEAERLKTAIAQTCVYVQTSVVEISTEFFESLNRRVYTTPKSYLDMISIYFKIIDDKYQQLSKDKTKYRRGVETINKTNEMVNEMQEDLIRLKPIIEIKQKEAEELSVVVERDTIEANKVKEVVEAEEKVVSAQTQEVEAIQKDAKKDLDQALPALEAATRALDQINPRDIAEIRTFTQPAPLIRYTLEAVSILLQEKQDWDSIKRTLQSGFIDRLKNYAKDSIPKKVLKVLRKKIAENPDFTPDKVGSVNLASKSICLWVFAMDTYARVSEEVGPKRERLAEMNKMLKDAKDKLKVTQAKLQKELDKVADLEAKRKAVIDEKDRLDQEAETTEVRLGRASILTVGLVEENERWKVMVEKLTEQIHNVVGDAFLAAACISYYGPFTGVYRNRLVKGWVDKCIELNIPVTPGFELKDVMCDPMTIRDWNIKTLPADTVSVNNGVLVTSCERWPLMIDPQEQANRWIKKLSEKDLKVSKQTERDFARSVENALRNGVPLLVEDIGETLNPSLDPILEKNFIEQGAGRYAIRMGDQEIDFDPNFKLYFTTKMPNPHYLPEITIKTTIINFTVTAEGLEEQLLGDVVKKELPIIEKKKTELMIAMANDQKSLKSAEDTILSSLTEARGNILDNPEIIETLQASKRLSTEIGERMITAEQNKKDVEEAFNRYEPVAVRGRILYFILADLAVIDPMYQYSLNYFSKLFNYVIEVAPKSDVLETRISTLITAITEFIFMNVCRGLFNAHKLIFSFIITLQILRNLGEVKEAEINLLLRGASLIPSDFVKVPNPDPSKYSDKMWDMITILQNVSPHFQEPRLGTHIKENAAAWAEWLASKEPQDTPCPLVGQIENLTTFDQLLLIKCLREEKVIYMVIKFVKEQLGRKYIEVPPISMEEVYTDTNSRAPIIFILSQGADPMSMMIRFAEDRNFFEKLEIISLGKGQGERARRLIESCYKSGKWVILQNCHLAQSWMPDLLQLVESFEDPKLHMHDDFRLYLTSMPCDYFPVPVLQNGVKLTNEPPKGIRANLMRSFNAINEEEFESCDKPNEWKKLLTGLCFFHAIIQERRKFGPLGWNIRYEFNEADLETSQVMLKNFLNEEGDTIPWDAMRFMTGMINYGGRVTDDLDRRCLMSILNIYLIQNVLNDDYKFSRSGVYYVPPVGSLYDFRRYAEKLPLNDEPEIFGMHDNANIAFQKQESDLIVQTALSIQPKERGKGSSGQSPDEIVDALASKIYDELPPPMLRSEALPEIFARDKNGLMESLATFLGQEMARFNKLLAVLKKSLEEIRKAIKGIVAMSAELDLMYTSMINNQVPPNWVKVAYPSLRPLSSWVSDLKERVAFIRKWLAQGKPDSFWLSSFFFPQGFLTAVLQSYSRKYQIPIDILNFSFDFQPFIDTEEINDVPEDGCFIHGLYMEGTRWDMESMQIEDSRPGEMYTLAPIIFFAPADNYTPDPEDYCMPLYKTTVRAGVLSTTGHSTNFIIGIDCPSSKKPAYWVLQGAAFMSQLND